MDSTDRQLLSLLREDARVPVATLAKTLKVARGTVQNRLARMEPAHRSALRPSEVDRVVGDQGVVAIDGVTNQLMVLRP